MKAPEDKPPGPRGPAVCVQRLQIRITEVEVPSAGVQALGKDLAGTHVLN